jgi:hypothetical protein
MATGDVGKGEERPAGTPAARQAVSCRRKPVTRAATSGKIHASKASTSALRSRRRASSSGGTLLAGRNRRRSPAEASSTPKGAQLRDQGAGSYNSPSSWQASKAGI